MLSVINWLAAYNFLSTFSTTLVFSILEIQPVKFCNFLRLLSLFRHGHFVKNILLKIAFQYFRVTVKVNLKTTVYLKP